MRNLGLDAKLTSNESPILFEIFKTADKIDEDPTVGVDKPVELIAVRHGMNTGAAAVFQAVYKLLKGHLVAHLLTFASLVKRDRALPRVAYKAKLEIAFEQVSADRLPPLERQKQVTTRKDSISQPAVAGPRTFQLVLYLPDVLMGPRRLTDDRANAGGPRFWNFDEYALVSV